MRLSEFDYSLPEELIAQRPAPDRTASRLLQVRRAGGSWEHHRFHEIVGLLRPGDLLVANDTRVNPVRLLTRRHGTGGRVELLLVRSLGNHQWTALARPSRRLDSGDRLEIPGEEGCFVLKDRGDYGLCTVQACFDDEVEAICERRGVMPLPPYIKRPSGHTVVEDRQRYQTVYAQTAGSIAAPTAGLHFSTAILQDLEAAGIAMAKLTLQVGLATFQPVRTATIEDHRLESESFQIPVETAEAIRRARSDRRRVVAVGTTSTRALESSAARHEGVVVAGAGTADLFIRPQFQFRVVDALITNFHLPQSTLLVLVAAFAGRELILDCYREAVRERYRFYSYGDCMLIE